MRNTPFTEWTKAQTPSSGNIKSIKEMYIYRSSCLFLNYLSRYHWNSKIPVKNRKKSVWIFFFGLNKLHFYCLVVYKIISFVFLLGILRNPQSADQLTHEQEVWYPKPRWMHYTACTEASRCIYLYSEKS